MKSIDESLPTPAVPDEIAELTEGLAHEVKNLLAPFRLGLEMITRQVDDARMQKLIGRLRGNADLATQLMDRLAEYGAATTVGNVFVPLGLEPFLREFVDTAEPATDAVAPLHLRLVQPLPEILGCADLIKIALANLVQNSRQAAAPGEPVEISAEPVITAGQTWVALSVRDHGPGLPAELRTQMDRPFFTTMAGGRSFGLGLPTVRRVLQAHRGELRIESAPGQGTVVSLLFPTGPRPHLPHVTH